MAAKSNLLNMALCLTLVCLFCAALLGGVYALTKEPIDNAAAAEAKAAIAQVLPEGGEISQALSAGGYEYYESRMDSGVNAYAVKTSTNGFGGLLTLMGLSGLGDVDAITASTITSRAYAKAVEQARELVKSLQEE